MNDVFGVGKAVEKLADPVVDIIKKVAGPAAEEIGLTLQDSIRVYRAKRQYGLFKKMHDFVKESGYEPKHIPLKLLLPAMDYASVEEDDDLHTAWAALLANAADPDVERVPTSFADVLRQLAPCDARLLNGLCDVVVHETLPVMLEHSFLLDVIRHYGFYDYKIFRVWASLGYSKSGTDALSEAQSRTEIGRQRIEDQTNCDVALDNLMRLRLVESRHEIRIPMPNAQDIQEGTEYAGKRIDHDSEQVFHITAFGFHFMQMCTKPAERRAKKQ